MKGLLEQIRASISGEYYMGQTWEIDALDGVIPQIEELELFKSEHLRLEAELNAILHPNGDGPTAPSFCDLVAFVREELKPKTCNWDGRIRTGCGRRLSRERGSNYPSFCPHCGGKVVRL